MGITSATQAKVTLKSPQSDRWEALRTHFDYSPELEPAPVPGIGHHAIVPIKGWKIGITQLTGPAGPPSADALVSAVAEMQYDNAVALGLNEAAQEEREFEDSGCSYRIIRCRTQQVFTYWGGHPGFVNLSNYAGGYDCPPSTPPYVDPDSFHLSWIKDGVGEEITPAFLSMAFKRQTSYGYPHAQVCSVVDCHQCVTAKNQNLLWQARDKAIISLITDDIAPPYPEIGGWKWAPSASANHLCYFCGYYCGTVYTSATHQHVGIVCYERVVRSELDKLPVPGMPDWYTQMHQRLGWRKATTSELWNIVDRYEALLVPGQFADECPPPALDTASIPLETIWVTTNISGAALMGSCEAYGSNFYTSPCVVCGELGSVAARVPARMKYWERDGGTRELGKAHQPCYRWLIESPLRLAHLGLEWHDTCTELVELGVISTTKGALDSNCRMCGEKSTSGAVSCPACEAKTHDSGAVPGHCRRCSQYARKIPDRELKGYVNNRFPLAMALADFYTLSDLALYDAEANDIFQSASTKLARELRNYTVIACGGELRHAKGNRQSAVMVYADPAASDSSPVFCAYPSCKAKRKAPCKDHPKYATEIVGIRGALGGLPYTAAVHPNRDGTMPYPNEIGRTGYGAKPESVGEKIAQPTGKWENRLMKTLYFRGRHEAWKDWREWAEEDPVEAMTMCRDMFMTGIWAPSIGGYWWGLAADVVLRYIKGEMSDIVFIDTVFGMQHNGGTLLSKIYDCIHLDTLLDLKRVSNDSAQLWPWTSSRVRDLYCRVAEQSGEPERIANAEYITQHRGEDTIPDTKNGEWSYWYKGPRLDRIEEIRHGINTQETTPAAPGGEARAEAEATADVVG